MNPKETNSRKNNRSYECLYFDQNEEINRISKIQEKKDKISWKEPEYKPVPSYFNFIKPKEDPDAKYYGPLSNNYKSLYTY